MRRRSLAMRYALFPTSSIGWWSDECASPRRVEAERDARRRGTIFGSRSSMSALRALVAGYIAEVFTQSRFERRALLRGVYFTSGTQEGTPIDRLMSSAGRALGLSSDVVASAPEAGESLLRCESISGCYCLASQAWPCESSAGNQEAAALAYCLHCDRAAGELSSSRACS